MTDLDSFRAELRAAVEPPPDFAPTPVFGPAIRARAVRRRRLQRSVLGIAAAAVAVSVGLGVAALRDPQQHAEPPAQEPGVTVPAGPRTLGTPVELREVIGTPRCANKSVATVPSVDGGGACFQLDSPELVVRRVQNMSVVVEPDPSTVGKNRTVLVLTLGADQAKAFRTLTEPRAGRIAALVVNGLVYPSPGLGDEKPDGKVRLTAGSPENLRLLVQLLTTG
jgi:hypothetical protein